MERIPELVFSYDGKILEGKHRVISCGSHSQVYQNFIGGSEYS